MKLGALVEPRTILTVVKDTMKAVCSRDGLLEKAMVDELSEPVLRILRTFLRWQVLFASCWGK
eukprot:3648781-Prorocentrum_lima.AAC.1